VLSKRRSNCSNVRKWNILDLGGLSTVWSVFKHFHLIRSVFKEVSEKLTVYAFTILEDVLCMLRDDVNPVFLGGGFKID